MFPTCKNSQKRVKNQKSTDKHSTFDGLIQEDIDLSDIYLAVTSSLDCNNLMADFFQFFWIISTNDTPSIRLNKHFQFLL